MSTTYPQFATVIHIHQHAIADLITTRARTLQLLEDAVSIPGLRAALLVVSLQDVARGPGEVDAPGPQAAKRRRWYADACAYLQRDDVRELVGLVGIVLPDE